MARAVSWCVLVLAVAALLACPPAALVLWIADRGWRAWT